VGWRRSISGGRASGRAGAGSSRSPMAERLRRARADFGGRVAHANSGAPARRPAPRCPRTPVATPRAPAARPLPAHPLIERPRRCLLPAPRTPVATAARATATRCDLPVAAPSVPAAQVAPSVHDSSGLVWPGVCVVASCRPICAGQI